MTKYLQIKSLSTPLFLIAALVFTLASCNKDNNSNNPAAPAPQLQQTLTSLNGDSTDCFAFNYPVTVNLPDSGTIVVNHDSTMFDLIEEFFDEMEDPDCYDDPVFNYPITVTLEDGTSETISDNDDLFELIESCFCDEHDDDEECFDFVYPIDVKYPDASTVSVQNWEELDSVFEAFYDVDTINDLTFVFPLDIVWEDGTVETVNNEMELEELFEECEHWEEWEDDYEEDCFEINYPITVLLPDGTSQVANSDDDVDSIFEAWEDNNPNSTSEPTLDFPITVTLDDGTTETINNEDELEDLFDSCGD